MEYDLHFKISGTYDSVPDEINEIIDILDLKNIISNIVEETKKISITLDKKEIPRCPKCGGVLSFSMPDGKALYCFQCDKYFINNNGIVGEETSSPYNRKDVLY